MGRLDVRAGEEKLEYKHQIWHGSKNLEKREEGSPKYQAPVSEGDLSLSITCGIKTANQRLR